MYRKSTWVKKATLSSGATPSSASLFEITDSIFYESNDDRTPVSELVLENFCVWRHSALVLSVDIPRHMFLRTF